MKKSKILIIACAGILIFTASCCNQTKENQTMETKNENTAIFPQGERGSSEWFTGTVWVQSLLSPDQMEGLYSIGSVTFEPNARTNWHTHPIGQTLLVTEGKGWYQERGKPAQELTKGSVIPIPKDVEHWHGAAADSRLVHIAITNQVNGNGVTWLSPVNNEEYAEVN